MPEQMEPTVVERVLWVAIVALAIAIGGPRLLPPSTATREKQLLASTLMLQNALAQFRQDTGMWPCTLTDLSARRPPAWGIAADGRKLPLSAQSYGGPYLVPRGGIGGTGVPSNPLIARQDTDPAHHWHYATSPGLVGQVASAVPVAERAGTRGAGSPGAPR